MKHSYAIGAKNGILEQKHLDALGPAVWLYLWFIDKQPEGTDKVLGGRPITYQLFAKAFPDVPRRTYVRWLDAIRKGGYVDLLRTPKGYVVTITKPKKWAKRDVPKMTHQSNSDVPKMDSDVTKVAHPMGGYGTSNIRETNRETNRNKLLAKANGENAENKPEEFGKADINELFVYWEQAIGIPISSRQQANRRAAYNLIRKHGEAGVQRLIQGVKLTLDDEYAPRISDFASLQSKLNELMVWGRKRNNSSNKVVEI